MINPFRRKRDKAPTSEFRWSQEDEVVRLALVEGGRPVPPSDWSIRRPEAISAVSHLLGAADDGAEPQVRVEDEALILDPGAVAALDAAMATSLGLPPPTPLALDLRPIGRIDEDSFRIDVRWVKPGGQPMRAAVTGAMITADGNTRRIPEPLWSLLGAARELALPKEKAERFRLLALLRQHWPEDAGSSVKSEPYLEELRVHYASSLSLTLRTLTPDRTDFDPVLFGQAASEEADSDGRVLDEELDNVLTPNAQKLFAGDRFRREADVRPVYVLRDGEYVFIDPSLRPALGAVRRLQDRPEAERRAFILNPRKVLREILGDEIADRTALDELFVETEQFSSRVAGVDVWRTPVLPWMTPIGKTSWLPERFGLRVGDDYFVVPAGNIATIIEQVNAAVEAGKPQAPVEGLLEPATDDGPRPPASLPVNDQLLEALRTLEPFGRPVPRDGDDEATTSEAWNAALQGKLFLVVHENFEEVEFSPFAQDEELLPPGPLRIPDRLASTLKPHQVDGLGWLVRSSETLRPGALLADDMGLGKTLQAIAFMAWLQEEAEAGRRPRDPFLIVAPTGLLGTWRNEIDKHLRGGQLGRLLPAFGSDLRLLREEDSFGARDIETGRAALKAEAWREAGVVLTTYETLRDYHFSFARTRFGLIVYDEIQKLKNPASQMTRAAKTLNAAFTLGMTGTPVENRLQDLWSIMDVIAPGLLGASRDFEKRHPADDGEALSRLKAQLTEAPENHAPYMLRRLKSDALKDMPAKHVHAFEGEMPPVQAAAYRDLVVRAAAASAGGAVGKGGMLTTLAALKGVSLHPVDPREALVDLEAYAQDSARLSRTLDILKDVAAKREKALIFVEDLAMQERLAAMVQNRFGLGRPPLRINGTVPGPKRQQMVDAFQGNPGTFDVMILSPKAGGVGLTLTAANHVIHLSRWWNPAVEDQATDRVFRIGQTRDVHVHLPMAVHPDPAIREASFDLRLNALIERKRKLTRDLFLPPDASEGELSDLYREVSLGGSGPAGDTPANVDASAPLPTEPEAPQEIQSSPETPRATLSLPKGLANAGIRRWRRSAGEARPTDEILALFAGREITTLTIRDPYAIARPASREAQVRFIADLGRTCRSLGLVKIEYAPEAEGDLQEDGQRREFGDLFTRQLPDSQRFMLVRRRKRARDDDFHDRFVELEVRHAGGAVRIHELSLGRGLEALYDTSKQCTVTYAPPGV